MPSLGRKRRTNVRNSNERRVVDFDSQDVWHRDISEEPASILVIDDDPNIRDLVHAALELDGYEAILRGNGSDGLACAIEAQPALILLDVMLPDMRGWDVLKGLRLNPVTADIPIIFLSALDETEDRVNGLALGAEDYIGKPFAVQELLARIRTQLRILAKLRDKGNPVRQGGSLEMIDVGQATKTHPVFNTEKFDIDMKSVFILMPFSIEFRPVFDDIIKPAVEDHGMRASRADDIWTPGAVMGQIWEHINEARFLIADLTDRNPNVFYELGLSLALGKNVILLASHAEDVPFDLQHMRYFRYSLSGRSAIENSKKGVKNAIKELMLTT
jgi:DNA-binding response OmpR family regulator